MSGSPTYLATIQRILVAVDGSDHSLAALEAACSLAAQLHAEIEALFVEDDDLLRLAELPCARVLSTLLMEPERTDRERMERLLRLLAGRAQEALQRHSVALGVRARFRAVRGRVNAELQAAAGEADLLSLGKAGHGQLGLVGPGSTLRTALDAGLPVLVVERHPRVGKGLLAAYDGSAGSARALSMAAQIAAGTGQELTILILGHAAGIDALSREALEIAAQHGQGARLTFSWAQPVVAIPAAVRRARPALVVLGAGERSEDRAGQLIKVIDCPLLVVP